MKASRDTKAKLAPSREAASRTSSTPSFAVLLGGGGGTAAAAGKCR
jgi:hypothetical protein